MTAEFDVVIRGGSIIDGTGAESFVGDVAVKNGKIAVVGEVVGNGVEEIDARGFIVTPGFVDIHTHYDGHATWTNRFIPSSEHGVTTVVTGNCGVGFAPCRDTDRDKLVRLMEGVEDIPEVVLTTGLKWNWNTFGDFLNILDSRQFDMDIACLFPHAPLRVFVMGERAVNFETATSADVDAMRSLARQAIVDGAIGFSTSRTLNHKASDGQLTPTYAAGQEELIGIAAGLKDANAGVLQIVSDFDDVDSEFDLLRGMASSSGRPLSFTLLHRAPRPELWRQMLDKVEEANADGLTVRAQVFARPIGMMVGLELSLNPFAHYPTYEKIAHLPFEERLAILRRPETRAKMLSEQPTNDPTTAAKYLDNYANMFELGKDLNYEPGPDDSLASVAARKGISPVELAYDLLTANDGRDLIYIPAVNYVAGDIGPVETMLRHPNTLYGLGDGGAHNGLICDASWPTYMLARWARGTNGRPIPLSDVVRKLTSANAWAMGLYDRGVIKPGYKADINVIDFEHIELDRPKVNYDLPGGGRRLSQTATGYVATIVSGVVTARNGVATNSLPGRLIRGGKPAVLAS